MSRRRKGKRPPESYRGKTDAARAAQDANLQPAPPAKVGNQLGLRHGAYSSRVDPARVDRQVAELVELLEGDPPLRAPDGSLPRHDRLALELLASVLVRLADLRVWLNLNGLLDPKTGNPRAVLEREAGLRGEAFGYAEALGMTPAARARLGLEIAEASSLVDTSDDAPMFKDIAHDPAVREANRRLVEAAGRARDRALDGLPPEPEAPEPEPDDEKGA